MRDVYYETSPLNHIYLAVLLVQIESIKYNEQQEPVIKISSSESLRRYFIFAEVLRKITSFLNKSLAQRASVYGVQLESGSPVFLSFLFLFFLSFFFPKKRERAEPQDSHLGSLILVVGVAAISETLTYRVEIASREDCELGGNVFPAH